MVRDWLEPCRYTLRQTRELLAFGVPMSLGALCEFASRRSDGTPHRASHVAVSDSFAPFVIDVGKM